jgi:copper chaperone CopZ
MKYKISLVIVAIAAFVFVSAPANAGDFGKKTFIAEKDTTPNKVVCYEVFGMDCPGCQSALEKQVKKIDGVANAKASFKEKKVVIELKPDAKVSDEEIEKRIQKANFTPGKKMKVTNDEK